MAEPGFIDGIPEAAYHAGPELSHSGAKLLLRSPARYRWEQDNPTPPTPAMELGTVVHSLILGTGQGYRVIDGGNGKTARADAARAEGLIPITAEQEAQAKGMAASIHDHPEASALLDKATGREVSAYATDPETGIVMRCRFDALGPTYGLDVKTTTDSADPTGEWFARTIVKYGYHSQAAWYLDLAALAGEPLAAFLFLFVEKDPPYLVSVCELSPDFLEAGRARNRRALNLYARCVEADDWPAYPGLHTIQAPAWVLRQEGL